MKIPLRCSAGHRWTYEGLQGDFADSHVQMQTNCPRCDRMVAFTIEDGVASGPGVDDPSPAAPPGRLSVRWPEAIRDSLRRR